MKTTKKAKSAAQLDREIAEALARPVSRPASRGAERFALNDAKLAVDIAAVRDQVAQLCERLRYDSRRKPQAVLELLSDAQDVLGDALGTTLTVEAP